MRPVKAFSFSAGADECEHALRDGILDLS